MTTILLLLALQSLPPLPPGYVAPLPRLQTPRGAETFGGVKMVRAVTPLPTLVPSGFVLTNITVQSNQVTLQWQQGQPLFQVQATSLDGQWKNISGLTAARTRTFQEQPQHFFRVSQSNAIPITITHTNPTTLTWAKPDTDMSDSLTDWAVDRSTDNVNFSQIGTVPAATANPSFNDSTVPSPTFYYRFRETTVNGVVVPCIGASVSAVQSGHVNWAQYVTSGTSGAKSVAVSPVNGDTVSVGLWVTTSDFGDGTISSPVTGQPTAFIVCRSSSGAFKWKKTFIGSLVGAYANSTGVQADSSGNFIVTGVFNGTVDVSNGENQSRGTITATDGKDIFLIKYSPTGSTLWAKRFGGSGGLIDEGLYLEIDSSDNIFLTGTHASPTIDFGNGQSVSFPGGTYAMFLAKFTPGSPGTPGVCLWATSHHGGGITSPSSIALDTLGNPYVVGNWQNQVDLGGGSITNASGQVDGFVVKYSGTTGNYVWAHTFHSPYGAFNSASYGNGSTSTAGGGIAINPINNHVLIVGSFQSLTSSDVINFGGGAPDLLGNTHGGLTYVMVSYDSDGNFLWQLIRGGGPSTSCTGQAAVFDSSGKCYVTGIYDDYLDLDLDGLQDTPGGGYFVSCWGVSGNNVAVPVWVQANRGQNNTGQGSCVRVRGNTVTTAGTWRFAFQANDFPSVLANVNGNAFCVQYVK